MKEERHDETGVHPEPEMIAACRSGELDALEAQSLREHLVDCETCRDLMLLGIDETGRDQPGVLDFEKEWIRTRVKAEWAARETAEARRQADRLHRQGRHRLMGLAASVLVVLLPLAGLGWRQAATIRALTRPQLNAAILDVTTLDPRGQRSGEAARPMEFTVPSSTEYYTVSFPLASRGPDVYRVEILDPEDRPAWIEEGLTVDDLGYATLGLSRRFLASGAYRIRVFSQTGGSEPVGDFPILIRFL